MNIANIDSSVVALSQATNDNTRSNLLLKKALQLAKQQAQQLLEALPTPPSAQTGRLIDTKA